MAVSRSGDSSGISYADHDVHHVSHVLRFSQDADDGPDTGYRDTRQWEITARGIDPDELAELRFMTIQMNLGNDADSIEQDEIGSAVASYETGFNLSGDEFVLESRSTEDIDTGGGGNTDFIAAFGDTDEVGQLTANRLFQYAGYSDTTDGTGGAASGNTLAYQLNFGDVFGSGPYVDAADDFVTSIELNVDNMVSNMTAEINASLYYRVEEVEGGRTRFGR